MTKTWPKHYHQIARPPDEHYTEEGFVYDMWPQWNILDKIENWLYTGQILQTGRCPTSTEDCALVPQRADPVGLSSDWFKMHSSCIQLHFKLLVAKANASPCAKDLQRNSENQYSAIVLRRSYERRNKLQFPHVLDERHCLSKRRISILQFELWTYLIFHHKYVEQHNPPSCHPVSQGTLAFCFIPGNAFSSLFICLVWKMLVLISITD